MRHDSELTSTPVDADSGAAPVVDHPIEVAAKRGFGPLSEYSSDVWHGGGVPCVTCAQLVRRGATMCDACGQDLSPEMIQKMRAHAGPWYVYEHVRPFPGVSLDRIIRQIHRGLITETSIVRGPTTDYQWRFAVETPGLCRYFQRCWQCHVDVSPSDLYCAHCLSSLSFDRMPAPAGPPAILRDPVTSSAGDLEQLAASRKTEPPTQTPLQRESNVPQRVASGPSTLPPTRQAVATPIASPAARVGGAPFASPELARLRHALQESQQASPTEGARHSPDSTLRNPKRLWPPIAWIAVVAGAALVATVAVAWRMFGS